MPISDHYQHELMKANTASIGAGSRIETEIDVARAAFQQARELSNFAHSIVSRLCGGVPATEASDGMSGRISKEDYDPDGVFPQLAQDARRAMADMNTAMSALRRLERLGS